MTQRCGDTLLFRTPPVIAAQAAVGGKKEGEGPLAAAFDELSSDNQFGQSSWEAAENTCAAGGPALPAEGAAARRKGPAGAGRGLAGPVYGLRLCHAGVGCTLCRGVRGLQYHGGNTGSGGCAVRLRGGGAPAGHGVQPFLCRRAAVPHPAELRRCTHPHRPVDRNGGRLLPAAACRAGSADSGGHLRPCAGLSGPGHQQHGRGHGPRSRVHPAALFCRHPHRAAGIRLHLHRGPGAGGQQACCGSCWRPRACW